MRIITKETIPTLLKALDLLCKDETADTDTKIAARCLSDGIICIKNKEEIFDRVSALMKWTRERTAQWYVLDNPNFGGTTAMKLVDAGRGHKVLQFIAAAEELNQEPS